MKRRTTIVALAAVIVPCVVFVLYFAIGASETTLELRVVDVVSKSWVWDATIGLQGRFIRSYFQSDQGPQELRFTRLKPGKAVIDISAPAYKPVKIPIDLKRGRNVLEDPVEMVGLEFPNLSHFIIFEDLNGADIVCQIRPVSNAGPAVRNHPVMDLWLGARVMVQMKDGLPASLETDESAVRGQELFSGEIEWRWDSRPETVFRYSARIPGSEIRAHDSAYRIVDYLLIVPKPMNSSKEEIREIARQVWDKADQEELQEYLGRYSSKFDYYVVSSKNVEAGA